MAPSETVLEAAQRLERSGTPCALVSVIRAIAPASAHAGDKAVVTEDGTVHGWVGGGCAQPVVVRAVRQVLSDGQARLIRIAPTTQDVQRDLGDVLEFGMACHSGGTLEMFVDPVLPRARLVVIGGSPVAQGLARLAPRVGFAVIVVAPGADAGAFADAEAVLPDDALETAIPRIGKGAWVVVATQGRRDVQGLRLALALGARQVSFVASARKAQVLKAALVAAGADPQAVAAIVAPAGYPMAATTPEEIALSVLAAVVSHRRQARTLAASVVARASGNDAVASDAVASDDGGVDAAVTGVAAAATAPPACCGGGGESLAQPTAKTSHAPSPARAADASDQAAPAVHRCCGD